MRFGLQSAVRTCSPPEWKDISNFPDEIWSKYSRKCVKAPALTCLVTEYRVTTSAVFSTMHHCICMRESFLHTHTQLISDWLRNKLQRKPIPGGAELPRGCSLAPSPSPIAFKALLLFQFLPVSHGSSILLLGLRFTLSFYSSSIHLHILLLLPPAQHKV